MGIIAVGNRLRDFGVVEGVPTDSTVSGTFDSSYVAGSINFPGEDDAVERFFTASGAVTWFRFTVNRSSGSGSRSGVSEAVQIRDASGATLLHLEKSSTSSNSLRFVLHGTSDVSGGVLTTSSGENRTYTIKIDQSGAGMVAEIYTGLTNPVLFERLTVADRGALTAPASMRFRLYRLCYTAPTTAHLTELVVATSSLLGVRLIAQPPSAVGDLADYAGTLADLNTDNPATGLTTDAAAERHTWTNAAYGGPALTLEALVAVAVAHRPIGTPARLASSFRIGGTNYDGANVLIDNPTRFLQEWPLNPSTGAAWTTAQLAGLQTGLKTVA